MRKAFTFYSSYYESIKELPISNQQELYKAIIEYSLFMKKPSFKNILLNKEWEKIKLDIDFDNKTNLRDSMDYILFRKSVLLRDNYTCKICGSNKKLNVHHIKSFLLFPKQRLNIKNGITLCQSCHIKEHTKDKINESED